MTEESADKSDDCPGCGYRPRKKDKLFVEDYQVTHVICYGCGMEWVE